MLSTACKVNRKTLILSELVVLLQFQPAEGQAARMWKAPDQLVQAVLCRKKLGVCIKMLWQSVFIASAWNGGLSGSWASFSQGHQRLQLSLGPASLQLRISVCDNNDP